MKKEIKTYEELLKCDGMNFEAKHNGKKIDGLIFVDSNKDVFCLQNEFRGSEPVNDIWKKHGYRFSWVQFKHLACGFSFVENTFKDITVDIKEKWMPKFGEEILVSDTENDFSSKKIGVFLFEKDGIFHVVLKCHVGTFYSLGTSAGYMVYKYKFIKQIESPKQIEITLEEAKKIIAESKNTTPDKINLNFKID